MIKCSNGHAAYLVKQYTGGLYCAEEYKCPVCGERIMAYETGDGYIIPAQDEKEGDSYADSIGN